MTDIPQVIKVARHVANQAREAIPPELLRASGRALYSPAKTLISGSPYYFLGLNPGEVPGGTESHSVLTVDADLARLAHDEIDRHGYIHEQWKGNPAGCAPIQQRGQHLFSILAGDGASSGIELLSRTPTSNMILHRSTSAESLFAMTTSSPLELALGYWPFHQAVIEATRCSVIITHAITVARRIGISNARPVQGCPQPCGA